MLDVKIPLIIVQFQQDYFCNPHQYPQWYGRILEAVSADKNNPNLFFLNLPGDHDCAEKLATKSQFEEHGRCLDVVWRSFWTAVTNAGSV